VIDIASTADGVEFRVKVTPNAAQDRLAGVWGGALKVAVTAAPESGKANQAVVAYLARLLDVRKQSVRIVAGKSQPLKRVAIVGITGEGLAARLRGLGISDH
jgi:hypothetical protein